jgi:hypothetical protein
MATLRSVVDIRRKIMENSNDENFNSIKDRWLEERH